MRADASAGALLESMPDVFTVNSMGQSALIEMHQPYGEEGDRLFVGALE